MLELQKQKSDTLKLEVACGKINENEKGIQK